MGADDQQAGLGRLGHEGTPRVLVHQDGSDVVRRRALRDQPADLFTDQLLRRCSRTGRTPVTASAGREVRRPPRVQDVEPDVMTDAMVGGPAQSAPRLRRAIGADEDPALDGLLCHTRRVTPANELGYRRRSPSWSTPRPTTPTDVWPRCWSHLAASRSPAPRPSPVDPPNPSVVEALDQARMAGRGVPARRARSCMVTGAPRLFGGKSCLVMTWTALRSSCPHRRRTC